MKEDLRGVFFIVRGQYTRNKGVRFLNTASGDYNHIGGYDPEDKSNPEWYMLLDNITFSTIACGGDLNKIVKCAKRYITTYKTKDRYLKMLDSLEYGSNKPSPIHRCLMEEVYNHYGDHFQTLLDDAEDESYDEVRDEMVNPLYKKTKKRLGKSPKKTKVMTIETPKIEETSDETPLKKVKPKKLKGIKKLHID